jgi:uncharacterized protein (DUF2384 family)
MTFAEKLGLQNKDYSNPDNRLKFIGKPVKIETIKKFKELTNSSLSDLAYYFQISETSIKRKLKESDEIIDIRLSEDILELMDLYKAGLDYYHSIEGVNDFLNQKNSYFSDKKPKELCNTHTGRQAIITLFNQIKYGIMP